MRVIAGEPARGSDNEPGEQYRPAIAARVCTAPPSTSRKVATTANPRERANTTCASRINASDEDGSGAAWIDIGAGSVYLAIVPNRELVNKRPRVRLHGGWDYSADG